jgi:hypothetical protein
MDTWIEAHKFILNMSVGDHYIDGTGDVFLIKKTKTRWYFSNGQIIHRKLYPNKSDVYYLGGKSVNQILRNIEGYLIYKIQSNF